MVGHEHIGVDGAAIALRSLAAGNNEQELEDFERHRQRLIHVGHVASTGDDDLGGVGDVLVEGVGGGLELVLVEIPDQQSGS